MGVRRFADDIAAPFRGGRTLPHLFGWALLFRVLLGGVLLVGRYPCCWLVALSPQAGRCMRLPLRCALSRRRHMAETNAAPPNTVFLSLAAPGTLLALCLRGRGLPAPSRCLVAAGFRCEQDDCTAIRYMRARAWRGLPACYAKSFLSPCTFFAGSAYTALFCLLYYPSSTAAPRPQLRGGRCFWHAALLRQHISLHCNRRADDGGHGWVVSILALCTAPPRS